MTLSDKKVTTLLKNSFECGWTDITGKATYAGTSGTHKPTFRAVSTTNCAGHHNVQMFFMTPSGRVVHCLPGYWNPKAFLKEAKLALALGKILDDPKLSIVEKNKRFLNQHLSHALEHDAKTRENSGLQGFDRSRMSTDKSGFKREKKGFLSEFRLKTTDQVVHERMAERPFLTFKAFDTAAFVNMGVKSFDSHNDGCHGGHESGGACDELAAVQARARAGKLKLKPGRGLPRIPVARPAQPARMPRPVGR